MLRTIFQKLTIIFISILIGALSITGAMLYFFLDSFVTDEKTEALQQSGEEIKSNLEFFIENSNNFIVQKYFEQTLKLHQAHTNSYIWVVDSNGSIIFSEPDMSQALTSKPKDTSGNIKLSDERQYKRLMNRETDFIKEIGSFYGFFDDEMFDNAGNQWLTVGVSFRYTPSFVNEEIVAAIYLHTPVPEIQKARISVFGFFLRSVGVAVLISIILIYFFSRRISHPLKEINQAAKVIAGGEFGKRLDIKSRDEVGELANSFNQMVTALQNLEEMRRGFIANVSHELRTPMTSIRGFIEGILDGTIPPERQNYYLSIVKDETGRLNRLVNDLLDLARMESGELELNMRSININELVRRSIIKLERLIVEKGLEVEASFEEEETFVNADPDSIERVIINLLHNAIKFTPQNGKITFCTQSQKDKVFLSIEDSGAGISSDELRLIWDRFYKSDKSRGTDKTGTGLGLAIVKNIVNAHNQNIWVESELGSGTKFTFTIEKA